MSSITPDELVYFGTNPRKEQSVAVRVKLELTCGKKRVVGVALANSGYESLQAEIVLPLAVARKLGISGKGTKEKFITLNKQELELEAHGEVAVRVLAQGRTSRTIAAKVYVSRTEDRIIMSDVLCGELGLDLVDVKLGIWRFRDDPPDLERPSER